MGQYHHLLNNNIYDKQKIIQFISVLLQQINDNIFASDLTQPTCDEQECCHEIQTLYKCAPTMSNLFKVLALSHNDELYGDSRVCILAKNNLSENVIFVKRTYCGRVAPLTSRLALRTLFEIYQLVLELIIYPYIMRLFKFAISEINSGKSVNIPTSPTKMYVFSAQQGNWYISYDTHRQILEKQKMFSLAEFMQKDAQWANLYRTHHFANLMLSNVFVPINLLPSFKKKIVGMVNN